MSLHWTVEAPPLSTNEEKYRMVADRLLGNRLDDVGMNVARMMSLYRFLVQNRTRAPEQLAAAITENGKPIFTPADISEMLAKIRKQGEFPFTQMLEKQRGGAPGMKIDPSRNKFWDRMIRKLTWRVSQIFPPSWDGFFWYVFILYSIEQMEFIGPFFSTALDTITLSLPVIADLAEEVIGKVISLAPVPYASFAGEAIGYAVALMFVIWAVFINMSRRHFGSAFKVALEGIPVFGDIISEAATYFETGAERYIQNRGRMLGLVQPISPTTYEYLDYWVPDDKIHMESMPNFPSYGLIKKDVSKYVLKATGADKMLNAAEAAQKSVLGAPGALAAAAQGAVSEKVAAAQNAAVGAVSAAQNAALGAVSEKVTAVQNAAANAVSKKVTAAQNAAVGAVSEKVTAASESINKKTKKAFAPMTIRKNGGRRAGWRKQTRRLRR